MRTKILRFMLLIATVFSTLTPVTQAAAQVESISSKGVSPEGMLNSDGTLNLDTGFNGSLDLSGYSVTIDPARGPVFGAARSGNEAPAASAVTPGDWSAIGNGAGSISDFVSDIVVSGADVYVAGNFQNVANIKAADFVAKWDGTKWSALGANGSGEGALGSYVSSLAVNGTDIYVGGSFSGVSNGSSSVPGAAYIAKWNGSSWSALGSDGSGGPSLNTSVEAITISGNDVYVGGWFTDVKDAINGTLNAADYVARWNMTNGQWYALGSDGANNGSLNSAAYDLAVIGSSVYTGGNFTNVKDAINGTLNAADYIAKWDGVSWSALGNNGAPGNGALDNYVNDFVVSGTDLYVGGYFHNVYNGGALLNTAHYVARWNTANSTWNALGGGSPSGAVLTLARDVSGNIYAAGAFLNAAGIPDADYVAKWDPTANGGGGGWSALGNNGASDGAIPTQGNVHINALAFQGSVLFAGGKFYDASNGSAANPQADFLAQWNGSNWNSVGTSPNGSLVGSNNVSSVLVNGTDVYVGGNFWNVSNNGINTPEADNIVKWDGTNWSALGDNGYSDGALNSAVYAMLMHGTDLYVAGGFNYAGGIAGADYIARWDTTNSTWNALGNGALNNAVQAFAFIGTDLYAGGWFQNAGGIPEADYIAKWDGSAWSALGGSGAGDGSLTYVVYTLAASGPDLYVGGGFTDINDSGATLYDADYIARWDGTHWRSLGNDGGTPVNGSLDSFVYTLTANGSDLYVGGDFWDVNNNGTILTEADYIARWDGSNWHAIGRNGSTPADGSLNNSVLGITLDGADVYVGGMFTDVNDGGTVLTAADNISKWDGTHWSALGNDGSGNGSINYLVRNIVLSGSTLLAGGSFNNINNHGAILNEADALAAYGLTPHAPSMLTITKLADTSDGLCDADCSLREAIHASRDGDTINFAGGLSGTILLNQMLIVDRNITINGPGAAVLSVSGNSKRILWNEGTTTISALTLTNGMVVDDNGGGIYNTGALTLDHVIVSDNQAVMSSSGYEAGGGIYNAGSLVITNSQINGNNAQSDGGAIFSASGSSLSMSDTSMDNNRAFSGNGGSLFLLNPASATPGTFSLNRLSITNSQASYSGGGIFLSASANISNSLLANNSVTAPVGSKGGGIEIYEAGSGAGYAPITVTLINLTITGNTTYGQGAGVDVDLEQASDSVTLNNLTIAGNHRTSFPGPTSTKGGGGIFTTGTKSVDIKNSIIAGNTALAGGPDCEGALNSLDYNLIQNTTNCTINGTTTHNKTSVDPLLGALTNNGGPTLTMSLPANSPAIDAANNCVTTDQRGAARPFDGDNNGSAICDMGAYELSYPSVASIARASGNPTGAASVNFTVTFTQSVTGVDSADFSLTPNGVSGAAVSGVSGTGTTYTVTVNTGTGNGTLRLDLLNNGTIKNTMSDSLSASFTSGETYTINKSAVFSDVPLTYWANSYIERLYNAHITGGCVLNPLSYCPDNSVTRAQMAVFLEKGLHGSSFVPPAATGTKFSDVPTSYWAASWIEALATDGITGGCGNGNYCPDAEVTRAQMAIFLLKSEHGSSYTPSPATGTKFTDVPTSYWAAAWIEQLAAEAITGGCGNGSYCPDSPVTRAQMAVFLVKAFHLP